MMTAVARCCGLPCTDSAEEHGCKKDTAKAKLQRSTTYVMLYIYNGRTILYDIGVVTSVIGFFFSNLLYFIHHWTDWANLILITHERSNTDMLVSCGFGGDGASYFCLLSNGNGTVARIAKLPTEILLRPISAMQWLPDCIKCLEVLRLRVGNLSASWQIFDGLTSTVLHLSGSYFKKIITMLAAEVDTIESLPFYSFCGLSLSFFLCLSAISLSSSTLFRLPFFLHIFFVLHYFLFLCLAFFISNIII